MHHLEEIYHYLKNGNKVKINLKPVILLFFKNKELHQTFFLERKYTHNVKISNIKSLGQ